MFEITLGAGPRWSKWIWRQVRHEKGEPWEAADQLQCQSKPERERAREKQRHTRREREKAHAYPVSWRVIKKDYTNWSQRNGGRHNDSGKWMMTATANSTTNALFDSLEYTTVRGELLAILVPGQIRHIFQVCNCQVQLATSSSHGSS